MPNIPIEIWLVILLACLGYTLVLAKIWRSSKPSLTYVVSISKEEAEKMREKSSKTKKTKKTKKPKKPKKPKAPSKPQSPPSMPSCKEGQFFGFLHEFSKRMPSTTPIPDNCLNCKKLLECMRKKRK